MPDGSKNKSGQLFEKARRYCAFQERCSDDLKKKLREWKADPGEINKILQQLQDENYISEERFARVFVGGKFRIKRWGRNKIKAALRAKSIPDDLIESALQEIDEEEYLRALAALVEKKRDSINDPQTAGGRKKIINYALSRGFESHLVYKIVFS